MLSSEAWAPEAWAPTELVAQNCTFMSLTVFLLLLWIAGSNAKHAKLPYIRRVVCACLSHLFSQIFLGPLRSRAAKAIGFIDMMIDYSSANAPLQKELSAGKLWTIQIGLHLIVLLYKKKQKGQLHKLHESVYLSSKIKSLAFPCYDSFFDPQSNKPNLKTVS
jgi:hypothetical protein